MCLHPYYHPIQAMWWFIWEVKIVQFVTHNWVHKNNCILQNEWSHDPVSTGFAPWWVRPHRVRSHIDSSSDQVLQIYLSHTEKKKTILCIRWNKTCLFLVFNLLNVNDELEIESLGWVHGGKLGGGELAMGQNWYTPMTRTFSLHCYAIRK